MALYEMNKRLAAALLTAILSTIPVALVSVSNLSPWTGMMAIILVVRARVSTYNEGDV